VPVTPGSNCPRDVLRALADETFVLVQEINHQRLGGLIDVALQQRKSHLKTKACK
jgi:hypothetical protein